MIKPDPRIVQTDKKLPFLGLVPICADLHYYAIKGFEIPTMPALSPEYGHLKGDLVKSILYRFRLYLSELHHTEGRRAIALQLMCDPQRSTFNSPVSAYILCRAAADELEVARREVATFADTAFQSFPQDGLFSYGSPRWLGADAARSALFCDVDSAKIEIAEIRKFEDAQSWMPQPSLQYVPHRFWAEEQRDPLLALIETLAALDRKTLVRVELSPVRLVHGQGLDFIALAGRWYDVIMEDLDRRASQGEKVGPDFATTEEMTRLREVFAAATNAWSLSYVKRGRHVFRQLVSSAERVFCMRVVLASEGPLSESVIGAVRTALSTPPGQDSDAALGWARPDVIRPLPGQLPDAIASLRYLALNAWGRSQKNVATSNRVDLRSVVTPEEAVALFHLPVYDRGGQTSALSTAEAPFVIPPETLRRPAEVRSPSTADDAERPSAEQNTRKRKTKRINLGFLYQRENLLNEHNLREQREPNDPGEAAQQKAQPFHASIDDLMKPSLLVGAPGSGKTNLAMSMLTQLWDGQSDILNIPFLVLDPSTGHEFRLLQSHEASAGGPSNGKSLRSNLVVYTVGDQEGLPLQFNPFSVPPGVTVRNHTTRLLAAFRAAFAMFDPMPAIYEAALERIYTHAKYGVDGRTMGMEEKGTPESAAPTLASFAQALQDEVNENAIPLYKGSAETIGIIRGATTIRIDSIGRKLGHIINVPGNSSDFFARMMQRPVVIELGALGDSSSISLVMAFFLTQLAGHIEHAYIESRHSVNGERQHLIVIEEAHRLLGKSDGESASGKSAEDLNMMLAEVRKFGQGILVMDQRPSSLVGGVLDNAYIKILTRLSDRVGFDRLSDELNLNQAQQRYAHTRLTKGDAILLDRNAGQPVLTRADPIKDSLEKIDRTRSSQEWWDQNKKNAVSNGLIPPASQAYVAPALPDPKTATEAMNARDWLAAQSNQDIKALLDSLRRDSTLYHATRKRLEAGAAELPVAKQGVDADLKPARRQFDELADGLWEKFKWSFLGIVAEEQARPEVEARIKELRASAGRRDPQTSASAADSLKPEVATLIRLGRNNVSLIYGIKACTLRDPPDRLAAVEIARREMQSERGQFKHLGEPAWETLLAMLVDEVASKAIDPDTANKIRIWEHSRSNAALGV